MSPVEPAVAWLARGRLNLKPAGQPVRVVESAFARQSLERRLLAQDRDGWKGRSGVWWGLGMQPPGMAPWELPQNLDERRAVTFGSVTRGDRPGEIFYVLSLDNMSGLFRYDIDRDEEQRLMHRNDLAARDLTRHPGSGSVAMSIRRGDGTAGIVVGENDGRFLNDVTFGDCLDESPAWIPGPGRRLVYQSAGIARDANGFARGLAPYSIAVLDVDARSVETLVEDAGWDYLQPRMLADGTLLYVRRPWRSRPPGPDAVALLKDVVLFPFRLARAFVHFFNVFSMMFSGKPLLTATGAQQRSPVEQRYLMLWGQMVDAQQSLARARKRGEPARLVPKEWELIRRTPDGAEDVLCQHVLSYDVRTNGDVLVTDGSAVEHIDASGHRHQLGTDQLVERVMFID
jgi:hypothetical protein